MSCWPSVTSASPPMRADADPPPVSDWPAVLDQAFAGLPHEQALWVAVSGGLDSSFLLAATATWYRTRRPAVPLRAVHVHHGLHASADDWEQYCRVLCRRLEVPLSVHRVSIESAGEGLEMAAREARYEVFRNCVGPGDSLLLAHHADDQAETVLYRLLRGSGVRGLSGMPAIRSLGGGRLCRPLLGLPRARILALADQWGIEGCQDPSNLDTRFDRNFLRHDILPRLRSRWPGVNAAFARAAGHCAEAEALLEERAREDMLAAACNEGAGLDLAVLEGLSPARRHNLLRFWIRGHGQRPPGQQLLQEGLKDLIGAREDGQPRLRWTEGELRRYRGRLYLLPPDQSGVRPAPEDWQLDQPLKWGDGELRAEVCEGDGLLVPDGVLRVTPRHGGERLFGWGGEPFHRPLKKWLQEQGIPPWERDRLPLFWLAGELVGVADLWWDRRFRAGPGEKGWKIHWSGQRGPHEKGLPCPGVFD